MLRLILISLLLFDIVFLPLNNNVQAAKNSVSQKCTRELLLEEAFLRSMYKEILNAINLYYKGHGKLYFKERITKITNDPSQDTFDVTVQVVTYERAIMPPYGLETITFRIPDFKIIDYKHKDIRDGKLPDEKFTPCHYKK